MDNFMDNFLIFLVFSYLNLCISETNKDASGQKVLRMRTRPFSVGPHGGHGQEAAPSGPRGRYFVLSLGRQRVTPCLWHQ